MNKWGKIGSQVLLIIALGVLIIIGTHNFLKRKGDEGVELKEVPFGLSAGIKVYEGRPYTLDREISDLNPFVSQLFSKAGECWAAGKPKQAITHLKEAMKLDKKALPLYVRLAEYHDKFERKGKTVAILKLYQKGLEIDPGHPLLRTRYGEFLYQRGDYTRAFQQFELASDLSPAYGKPYIGLGRLLLRQERFSLAKEKLKTAITLMQGNAEAPYDLLALAYYRTGQDDSAGLILDYAKELGLESSKLKFVEGLLWEAAGNANVASGIYKELIKMARTKSEFKQYKWALATLGRKPPRSKLADAVRLQDKTWQEATAAIEILEPLTRRFPRNGPLLFALGLAYSRRGLYGHALECYDSVLKVDSTFQLEEYRRSALAGIKMQDTIPVYIAGNQTPLTEFPVARASDPEPRDEDSGLNDVVLGHFFLRWNTLKEDAAAAYPDAGFTMLKNGNWKKTYFRETLKQETVLGFKSDRLWGIWVSVTDTAKGPGDLFGDMIGVNSRLSGTGKATGISHCAGYKDFQGVIWENEDTLEFLVQFKDREWQVRMIRIGRKFFKKDPRLCDLIALLDTENWK